MKLALHMQQMDANVARYVNDGHMPWVKLMLYEDQTISENPFPNTRTIGRVWIGGDGVEAGFVARGYAGGEAYFRRLLPFYRLHPWVDAWEGPANEPSVDNEQHIQNLVGATRTWASLMHLDGLRTVGLNLGVGWPQIADVHKFDSAIDKVDYIGLHEYSAPAMWDGASWYCLRYRQTFASMGKPLLITECGIDGGVISQPRKGWRTFATEQQCWEQAQWYEREMQRDDCVEAAFWYGCVPTPDWKDFEPTPWLYEQLRNAHLAEQTIEQRILEVALKHGISVAPGTALFDYIERHGWHVQDEERDVAGYRFRRAYDDAHREYIAYCPIGQWHLVRHMEVPK